MEKHPKTNKDLFEDLALSMVKGNEEAHDSQGETKGDSTNPAKTEEETEVDEIEAVDNSSEASEEIEDTDATSETESVEDTEAEEEDEEDEWWKDDSTSTSEVEEVTDPFNYSELANELGVEIKSKEDLVREYNKLKEDASKVVNKSKEEKELPADLAQAIELAKNGEDYSSIFNKKDGIDHSSFDDRTLLINQNAKYFTTPDGVTDTEALTEYVDDMTEIQQKIEASKVRENIEAYNQSLRDKKIREDYERRQNAQIELQNVVSSTNEIKGFKVTPEHKEDVMNKISSGEAVKEMFMKKDGSYDMKKLVEVYFVYKNFDKMKNYLSRRSKDEARKKDFEGISNVQITTKNHRPNVTKVESDPMSTYMKELENNLKKKAGINVE